MIPHAAGMDGIQRTPPFCGSWLPWLACTEGVYFVKSVFRV